VNRWTEECAYWQNREKLPSFKERAHAGMLPGDTQQGKEQQSRARNAWRRNQPVYTQQERVAAAALV